MTENIAVFTAIPSASAAMAATVKLGVWTKHAHGLLHVQRRIF